MRSELHKARKYESFFQEVKKLVRKTDSNKAPTPIHHKSSRNSENSSKDESLNSSQDPSINSENSMNSKNSSTTSLPELPIAPISSTLITLPPLPPDPPQNLSFADLSKTFSPLIRTSVYPLLVKWIHSIDASWGKTALARSGVGKYVKFFNLGSFVEKLSHRHEKGEKKYQGGLFLENGPGGFQEGLDKIRDSLFFLTKARLQKDPKNFEENLKELVDLHNTLGVLIKEFKETDTKKRF